MSDMVTTFDSAAAKPGLRAVVAGAVGNTLEWYDFAVYSSFIPLATKLFFPSKTASLSLLLAFATFGVGFVMRPVGGYLFGRAGDRIGRRTVLATSVGLMGVATFLVGVLPAYAEIGILAPILLVLLRLLQGLSAGGEFGGASTFLVEYAPSDRRGFFGSWQQFGVSGGLLLGAAMSALLDNLLTAPQLHSWGWRIPFLIGIVIAAFGVYIRFGVRETPTFQQVRAREGVSAEPIAEALRAHRGALLRVIGFTLGGTIAGYVLLTYLPNYAVTQLKLPLRQATLASTLALVLFVIVIPFTGALSDRVGRKPVMYVHAVGWIVLAYPLFALVTGSGSFLSLLVAMCVGVVLLSFFSGPNQAAFAELFPTRVRYSGISVPYNIAVAVFGGTAPFVAAYLLSVTKTNLILVIYIVIAEAITLATFITARETYRAPLG